MFFGKDSNCCLWIILLLCCCGGFNNHRKCGYDYGKKRDSCDYRKKDDCKCEEPKRRRYDCGYDIY